MAQTTDILKQGITEGRWEEYLPGELALCQRLQVSRVTLRAALDQLQREGWCSAGQGRRRTINKRHIRGGLGARTDRVVLLSPLSLQSLPTSAFYWIDALRDHLAAAGYQLEFIERHSAFSKHPGRALEALAQEFHAAGWVLYLSTESQQRWFSEQALPCVVSGSCHPGVQLSSVDVDYAATCSHAVGRFSARGRTRLALLMPRSGQAGNLESERGFMDAVGRLPSVSGQVAHHDGTVSSICYVIDRLLGTQAAVDGLLVAKPAHVMTALTHLLRRGIRLPQDLSLISRDDDPLLEHLVPVVSRYRSEPAAFARKISRLVVDLVRTGQQRRHESRLMPTFARGETLG